MESDIPDYCGGSDAVRTSLHDAAEYTGKIVSPGIRKSKNKSKHERAMSFGAALGLGILVAGVVLVGFMVLRRAFQYQPNSHQSLGSGSDAYAHGFP